VARGTSINLITPLELRGDQFVGGSSDLERIIAGGRSEQMTERLITPRRLEPISSSAGRRESPRS
jgi:hypothetical protein